MFSLSIIDRYYILDPTPELTKTSVRSHIPVCQNSKSVACFVILTAFVYYSLPVSRFENINVVLPSTKTHRLNVYKSIIMYVFCMDVELSLSFSEKNNEYLDPRGRK
jgi:hypothetical protein